MAVAAAAATTTTTTATATATIAADAGLDRVIARFDYKGTTERELAFKKGDILVVVSKDAGAPGWWQARHAGTDAAARLIPVDYVKPAPATGAAATSVAPAASAASAASAADHAAANGSAAATAATTTTPLTEVIALFDYAARSASEFTMQAGDVLALASRENADWLQVHSLDDASKRGRVPASYAAQVVHHTRALYDYTGDASQHQLSLVRGDHVVVFKVHDQGWWEGFVGRRKGSFPFNYVEAGAASAAAGSSTATAAAAGAAGGTAAGDEAHKKAKSRKGRTSIIAID